MDVFAKFAAAVGVWTMILLGLLSGISLIGGQGLGELVSHLPVWGGLALVLSAFPAGIASAGSVFSRDGVNGRASSVLTGAALALATLTFLLVAFAGPAAVRAGLGESASGGFEPNAMSLTELRTAARLAVDRIETEVGRDGLSLRWLEANQLAWHYHRRIAAVAQPRLFAVIGLCLGFWGGKLAKRELASLLYWSVGLFLVMSTYLAGENSYELIVLRAAGPSFFAGFFVLIVPPVLAAGLAIPTAVAVLNGEAGSARE